MAMPLAEPLAVVALLAFEERLAQLVDRIEGAGPQEAPP
jgi:hypothetical protein